MLVVPELEKEVKLLWHLRDTRKVNIGFRKYPYWILMNNSHVFVVLLA